MKRPGKFIVSAVAVIGSAALVVGAFALQPLILEQWYLWKLGSAQGQERWTIAEQLQALGSGATEDWYIGRLDSDDEKDQELAAEKLSELGTPRAIAALIEKLPDDYRFSKSHFTVKALVSIGEPAAPLLFHKVQEGKRRFTVFRILSEMGPAAVSVLVTALNDESLGIRLAAVLALDRIGVGSDAAIRALIENLEDPNKFIRWHSAFALLTLDPERIEAVPLLIEALNEGDVRFKGMATVALGKIGPAARDAIPALEEARKSAASMSIPSSLVKRLQMAAAEALQKIQGGSLTDDQQR